MRISTTAHSPFARAVTLLAVAFLAAVTSLVTAGPAAAHAQLVSASPGDGASVSAAPPEIALTFNENIGKEFVTVTVAQGSTSATQGDPTVEGATVYQPLTTDLGEGEWTVSYRVVSADGHPVSGSYSFTYGPDAEDGVLPEGEDTGTAGGSKDGSASSGATDGSTATDGSSSAANGPSSGSRAATGGSGTSAPSESEFTVAESPASSATTDTTAEQTDSDGGLPGWFWPAAVAAVLLGAALAYLALRSGSNRGSDRGDERSSAARREHPEDVDDPSSDPRQRGREGLDDRED